MHTVPIDPFSPLVPIRFELCSPNDYTFSAEQLLEYIETIKVLSSDSFDMSVVVSTICTLSHFALKDLRASGAGHAEIQTYSNRRFLRKVLC